MILILTDRSDEHAQLVATRLRDRDEHVVLLDHGCFPAQMRISVKHGTTHLPRYTVRSNRETLELDDCTAIWFRRPTAPTPHDAIGDHTARRLVQADCRSFLHDFWDSLVCLWVPAPPSVVMRTQLKVSQLRLARELGFELPPTLITNSPEDFLDFYREHDGHIVSKLAGLGFFHISDLDHTFCRYTEPVTKRDVGYAQSVRYCPVIFQAYVRKRLELRITVVGEQLFAAEIHSQKTHHTRHDWRRYDLDETPHYPHALPSDVAERCVRLVQRLGLCYGAVDMVLTPEGQYVFLELNPSGQYLWIEQLTGLPITDALCDLLVTGKRERVATPELSNPSGGLQ
jgi:hypothetical protein